MCVCVSVFVCVCDERVSVMCVQVPAEAEEQKKASNLLELG